VYGVAEAIATMGRKQGPSTGTIST
jgi:hypothetical protein